MLEILLLSQSYLLELIKAVSVGQEEDVWSSGRAHLSTELGGAKAHLIVQPYLDSNLCLFKYHQVVNFVKITRLSIL